MTPEQEQRRDHGGWRNWNRWSTRKKISSVIFMIFVLMWYVFWSHLLPKMAEDERKAGIRAAASSAASPNLQIPKPNVPITPQSQPLRTDF